MNRLTKDPLLAAAQVIVAIGLALLVFVAAMVLIGIGALLTVGRSEVMAELAANDVPGGVFWALIFVLVVLEGLLYLGLRFLLELRGIIKSVERGDPFEPANADRLSRMGWLTVGSYGLAIVMGLTVAAVKRVSGELGQDVDFEAGLGGGGLLLILVLFILARVFRQGAKMREELEGTV
jgi:hypothetical protein